MYFFFSYFALITKSINYSGKKSAIPLILGKKVEPTEDYTAQMPWLFVWKQSSFHSSIKTS